MGGCNNKRMNFPLQIVDAVCKVREKSNKPDFIIGYRLFPEDNMKMELPNWNIKTS